MAYYPLPEDALEEATTMIFWAKKGIAAALRQRQPLKNKGKT
ncbi:TfoX/Sxy family protein [Janthinobacterium sp. B9-8]|nr:TfoX/Sxy family protein [Janthinobacterium sp. B9-8]